MKNNFFSIYKELLYSLAGLTGVPFGALAALNILLLAFLTGVVFYSIRVIHTADKPTANKPQTAASCDSEAVKTNGAGQTAPRSCDVKKEAGHCLEYRAENLFIRFRYMYSQNSWRAYIINRIDYGDKSANMSITHRHYDFSLGMHYVCWTADVRWLDDMVAISKTWADATAEYIKSGKLF